MYEVKKTATGNERALAGMVVTGLVEDIVWLKIPASICTCASAITAVSYYSARRLQGAGVSWM